MSDVLPARARTRARPEYRLSAVHAVAVLITLQLIVWTLVPYVFHSSMPLDITADGISWGHEWQLGYYKHPPLPSWLVEAFYRTLGDFGPFLLSQLAITLTYYLVFRLGCELMDPAKAALGTLLLACVYYFGIPTPEWNHNVVQIPLWAAISLWYWRAYRDNTLTAWIAFGVCAGLGMLAKYATSTLLLALFLHLVTSPQRRDYFRSPALYAAFAAFVLVVSPHLWWAAEHGFPSIGFFVSRAGHASGILHRFLSPIAFLGAQAAAILPAVCVAALGGLIGAESRKCLPLCEEDRFLLFAGIGPAILTAFFSLFSAMGLLSMWGTPMWCLTGILLVRSAAYRWNKVSVRRCLIGVGVCFTLYPAGYLVSTEIAPRITGAISRTEWPARPIAEQMGAVWADETHAPLRVVTGESWIAGLVSTNPQRPSVFIDADRSKAPWITPQRLQREGTLIVWQVSPATVRPTPAAVLDLARDASRRGERQFSWPANPRQAPLVLGWAIIPPKAAD